jgi:glutamine synthetase
MQLVDVQGNTWDTAGLGFSDGDPDALAMPVPGTLAAVPWAPEPRAQCLLTLTEPDGTAPLWYDPRVILEGVVRRFDALGLTPVVAMELEFYLIDRARTDDGAPQPPISPRTGRRDWAGKVFGLEVLEEFGEVIGAIEAACLAQGLPVTTISSEYGPGQFEINLSHLADPVRAADHAALLRRAIRAVARAHGMDATFLSKPYADLSGSGLQTNLSLSDKDGNIFDPRRADGGLRLGQAIAGMQAALAESMVIHAPNLNVYRRFEANQFTPVTIDWGTNNRSVAFRVPDSAPEDRRIEHRAGGAEANPYLVMAAVLAAAHHGLANRLTPTEPGSGNMGAEIDPAMPLRLWRALDCLERAAILPAYLGQRYIDAYVHVKRAELDAFMGAILPREHEWYL